MDRIWGQLLDLGDADFFASRYAREGDTAAEKRAKERADALRQQIADEWQETVGAGEAVLKAVEDDPSLQEQLVIAHFGGDENLPFAKAIRQLATALARAKGES